MEERTVGAFAGVSYSTKSEGERIVTGHTKVGSDSDPHGGWKQSETLTAEEVELPSGERPEPDQTDFLGQELRESYEVSKKGGKVEISDTKSAE